MDERVDETVQAADTRERPRRDALQLAMIWSIIGLFVIALFTVIETLSLILMPVTFAIVVGLILSRAAARLGKSGIPPVVTGLILSAGFFVVSFFTVNALVEPLGNVIDQAPDLLAQARDRLLPILGRYEWLNFTPQTFSRQVSVESIIDNAGSLLSVARSNIVPLLIQTLIFFAALALFLAGRVQLRQGLIMMFRRREKRLTAIRVFNAVEEVLGFYFATACLIYGGIGITVAIIAFAAGFAMPVLWGFLAFLSSFVPFLGFAIITLALALAGFLTHDTIVLAILPALAFFVIHMIAENLVVPSVMGKRLEINPFLIFLAILFWTWMWGAAGAMLALPVSLIAMTIVDELLIEEKHRPSLPG
ncbi:AI-2E family transporter [Rhizobiaceae bacterium BDR2-2]|uniref:AI-2E family transporter n=1 Tax=Ectorhizobium quercum TaxID=2965071 RepID=A0AAE3N211_9HYPH|nr:AI-2E family transporter [Ectorhizobium quercum]MCX8998502.1 AI-2E family transporter [Ectorhizobium quercum]